MKSFAARTRDSLTREDASGDAACCRRAELTGFALSCGSVTLLGGGGIRLTMRSEHPGTVRRIMRLLRAEFAVMPQLRVAQANRLGVRRRFEVRLETADAEVIMSALGLSPVRRGFPRQAYARKCCASALLRGIFLGCGSLTDPSREYLMEFLLGDEPTAEAVARLLAHSFAVRAGISNRKSEWVVYVRDSESMLLLLSRIGAHGALLELENVRIVREARNRANRAANCDAANITKMLNASDRSMEAIARIDRTIGLSALPDTLREIAIERRLNADVSLVELGALLSPPVGKSGVFRRLRRLEAIAQSLEDL